MLELIGFIALLIASLMLIGAAGIMLWCCLIFGGRSNFIIASIGVVLGAWFLYYVISLATFTVSFG